MEEVGIDASAREMSIPEPPLIRRMDHGGIVNGVMTTVKNFLSPGWVSV